MNNQLLNENELLFFSAQVYKIFAGKSDLLSHELEIQVSNNLNFETENQHNISMLILCGFMIHKELMKKYNLISNELIQ